MHLQTCCSRWFFWINWLGRLNITLVVGGYQTQQIKLIRVVNQWLTSWTSNSTGDRYESIWNNFKATSTDQPRRLIGALCWYLASLMIHIVARWMDTWFQLIKVLDPVVIPARRHPDRVSGRTLRWFC